MKHSGRWLHRLSTDCLAMALVPALLLPSVANGSEPTGAGGRANNACRTSTIAARGRTTGTCLR